MSRIVSLSIDAIAAGGDGVGRNDGLVVFVPRTAPGDVVTATTAGKGHFARGALRTIQRPSPERTEPQCPHYTRENCGGCQMQHMIYSAQLVAKQRIIADAMTRIGKRDVASPDIVPSDQEWRYRTKLTLAMRRRPGGWIAGMHPYDDPGRVFALADCPITDRRVVATWREVMAASEFLPNESALRGSVRWTADGPTFVLVGGRRWSTHDSFFEAIPSLAALYWEPEDAPRKILGDRRSLPSPAAAFAQVNPAVAESVRNFVVQTVLEYKPDLIIDAYSGAGDLAAALATEGFVVIAIELDPDAAGWAKQRLPFPSRAYAGKVEDLISRLTSPELVVLNPPRGGVHNEVTRYLDDYSGADTIIYISCDPATLARDVARLPGYRIQALRAFDMFPQTAHVETVCVLRSNDCTSGVENEISG